MCWRPFVRSTALNTCWKPCGWLSINSARPTRKWVRGWVPREWYERYGPRAASFHLPKAASQRETLAVQIGADGYTLMDAVLGHDEARHLRPLPALEVLRCVWLQQYSRCTEPGMEEMRWRGPNERPPSALLMQSPYDLE